MRYQYFYRPRFLLYSQANMNQTYYPKPSLFSDIKHFGVIDNRYEQRAYSREMPSKVADMSVQYTAIFHGCKNDNFQMKNFDIFLILQKT